MRIRSGPKVGTRCSLGVAVRDFQYQFARRGVAESERANQSSRSVSPGIDGAMIRSMATAKRTASIDEVLSALDAARDKVMADEVKQYTKLGIPKSMAYTMVASRYHQKVGGSDEAEPDPFEAGTSTAWDDIG